MFALRDNERRTLVRLSLTLTLGALSLLPLTAPSSLDAAAEAGSLTAAPVLPDPPARQRVARVELTRDPFAAENAIDAPNETTPADASEAALLPPNGGASLAGAMTENGAAIVRAIILGPQARALVESGNDVRILGVGDALGASSVSSIDAAGIVLRSGVRIPLAGRRP
jgi:hypothetical protein